MIAYAYTISIIGITGLLLPANIQKWIDIPFSILVIVVAILFIQQANQNRLHVIKRKTKIGRDNSDYSSSK